jgi:hypothetical protein
MSHGAEKKHLKAISLIEELNERTRRQRSEAMSGRNDSERQKTLDPKRLLCFTNKSKKDQYQENGEPNRKRSPWRSRSIVEHNSGRQDERTNTSNISALCNELCQDYYEIRKKLKNRPIVLTPKKAQILEAIAGSNLTTSSSVDAPIRKFDNEDDNYKGKNCLHFSNSNRELHRRHRSLLDDNASIHSENNKSKSNTTNSKKLNPNRSKTHESQSDKSRSSRSNTNKSKRQKSIRIKSFRMRDAPLEIATNESTEYSIPVSFVERRACYNGGQSDISMISTMSSSLYSTASYSTCDESTVILSPRRANDKVDLISKSNEKKKTSNNLALVCAAAACSSPQPKLRHQESRNPISVGMPPSNLGTITEGDDSSSPSTSSASSSSYCSLSSNSNGGSYYSSSGADRSVDYGNDRIEKAMLKTSSTMMRKKNANNSCSIPGGVIWNAIMFDEGNNSIIDKDVFHDEERRDDVLSYK